MYYGQCKNGEYQKTYHGDVPEIWRKGGILPLPKKGELGQTTNYRGITLTAAAPWIMQ